MRKGERKREKRKGEGERDIEREKYKREQGSVMTQIIHTTVNGDNLKKEQKRNLPEKQAQNCIFCFKKLFNNTPTQFQYIPQGMNLCSKALKLSL